MHDKKAFTDLNAMEYSVSVSAAALGAESLTKLRIFPA